MPRWTMLVLLLPMIGLIGCSGGNGYQCIVENTDSFNDPVALTWDVDPIDQPNPSQLKPGWDATFTFDGMQNTVVNLNGYDPIVPALTDDITVSLTQTSDPGVRVIEWDGFQFFDRGVQTLTVSKIVKLATGQATILKAPSKEGLKPNPKKQAAARRR